LLGKKGYVVVVVVKENSSRGKKLAHCELPVIIWNKTNDRKSQRRGVCRCSLTAHVSNENLALPLPLPQNQKR